MRIPRLHRAARDGDLEVLERLLGKRADPNLLWVDGVTPLHMACDECQVEAARLLLNQGADPLARGSYFGDTALHIAARRGCTELVESLLNAGCDPNALDYRGRTPLHYSASGSGTLSSSKLLLDRGTDLSAEDEEGETALTLASLSSNLAVVYLLVVHRANLAHQTSYGQTANEIARRQLDALLPAGKNRVPPGAAYQLSLVRDILRLTSTGLREPVSKAVLDVMAE